MKYRIVLTTALFFSLLLSGCADNIGCRSLRNYQTGPDKKINELKEKIADLEKERLRDEKTSTQLANAYNQLGMIYLEKKLWDSAIESFQGCMKNGMNGASIQYALGLAYANRGKASGNESDFAQAEKSYRRAIELQNDLHDAKYALAILQFYHLDEKDEAVSMIASLVSDNRKHYKGRFALGRFYYETDRNEQALNVYEDLYDDLAKVPDSQIIEEFRNSAKENINILMMELSHKNTEK